MTRSIATVLAAVVVIWLLRWSFGYVVRGQRPDMATEKEIIQGVAQGIRNAIRLARWYWHNVK
jgi:hypothetical protein